MTPYPARRWTALVAVLAFLAALPALAGAAAPAEAPRVTAADVKALVAKKDVVIVDVRTRDAYDQEHVEGAISIPLTELEGRLGELPKNKLIASYCT